MVNQQHLHPLVRGGWWPCEEKVLKSMYEEGQTVKNICLVLGREYKCVFDKIRYCKKLGKINEVQKR